MTKFQNSKLIFFGNPDFAVTILKALIEHRIKPVAVVTTPDKPKGRGKKLASSPVTLLAEKHAIPILQPAKLDSRFEAEVISYKPAISIIASYGKIIPKTILDIPTHGTINVHPSLLPKYRGPSPIQTAILNGDKTTGVTLMLTDEKMDHGPILAMRELETPSSKMTYTELHNALAQLGAELLIEALQKWINGEITPRKQDHAKATFTKLLTKENGRIDWSKTAEEIERQVRAFEVWPGSFGEWRRGNETMRLKIIAGHVIEVGFRSGDERPGHLFSTLSARGAKSGEVTKIATNELAVQTKSGLFVVDRVQPEGRRIMNGKDFLNGYPGVVSSILREPGSSPRNNQKNS